MLAATPMTSGVAERRASTRSSASSAVKARKTTTVQTTRAAWLSKSPTKISTTVMRVTTASRHMPTKSTGWMPMMRRGEAEPDRCTGSVSGFADCGVP